MADADDAAGLDHIELAAPGLGDELITFGPGLIQISAICFFSKPSSSVMPMSGGT